MKLKNILCSLMVGAVGICLPNLVDAASLNISSVSDTSGSRVLAVTLSKEDSETVTSVTLGACDVHNTDISCVLKPDDNIGFSKSGSTYTFTDGLENGTVLANITVSNETGSKVNFSIDVANASINGTSQTVSTNSSVQAKAVEKTKSSDASLKSVSFNQINGNDVKISPEFDKDVYDYVVYNIPDTINSIKFNTECNEGECTVNVSGGASVSNKTVTLNQGANSVKLTVTSEDYNSNKTYNFTVYRGETSFNSAKLSSLSFGDYTLSPEFSGDTTTYAVSVPNKILTLSNIMEYETEDEGATIEADGYDNLVVGTNTVTIKVTNADGDQTITYTITVTRLADGEISILNYKKGESVTFLDSEGVKNTLTEDEFKEQYPDAYQDIKDGKYKFDEDGNLIVEDEANELDEEKSSSKTWIIIVIIVVGLIIIGVSAFLIFGKKKPKKDKKNNDDKKEEVKHDEEETKGDQVVELADDDDEIPTRTARHESSLDDDTIEIDEDGIEEKILEDKKDLDRTVSVDEALEDLMKTRQYDFDDEDKD